MSSDGNAPDNCVIAVSGMLKEKRNQLKQCLIKKIISKHVVRRKSRAVKVNPITNDCRYELYREKIHLYEG